MLFHTQLIYIVSIVKLEIVDPSLWCAWGLGKTYRLVHSFSSYFNSTELTAFILNQVCIIIFDNNLMFNNCKGVSLYPFDQFKIFQTIQPGLHLLITNQTIIFIACLTFIVQPIMLSLNLKAPYLIWNIPCQINIMMSVRTRDVGMARKVKFRAYTKNHGQGNCWTTV